MHEPCEPSSCTGDSTQFKGIFIRNLRLLHSVAPDEEYSRVITASADSLDHGVLNVQYSWSMSRLDTPVFNLLIFMTSESMHYLDDSHYSPVSSQHLLRLCFEFGYKDQS